jgi:two-component system sensor histidine kinase DegS
MDVDNVQARAELNNLKISALSTFQKVRNFIFELRPMMLDDLGLFPTIKRYIDTFKEQTGMETSVSISGQERRLESFIEVMIFRALQELLGNAARHSQGSLVKVVIDMGENLIKVSVNDNGKGFNTETLNQGNSLGLNLIRDRVEILGGTFEIDSTIGKGSRITLAIPVKSL